MPAMTVLIVDDEPLARTKLQRLVADHELLVEAGTASTGVEAIKLIDDLKPVIVFLDIRMPGASGLEVVEQINHRPHIIFTTAYDEFAVTAFELQAVDYLLKPFGKTRFTKAVERVVQFETADLSRIRSSLSATNLERLYVRDRRSTKAIDVSDILLIRGAGDYAEVFTTSDVYLIAVRMKMLEERLDSERFVRIHRSTIVNIAQVSEIQPVGNGRYEVTLRDGRTCVASRSGATALKSVIRN